MACWVCYKSPVGQAMVEKSPSLNEAIERNRTGAEEVRNARASEADEGLNGSNCNQAPEDKPKE